MNASLPSANPCLRVFFFFFFFILFVILVYPETADRSLEQMHTFFQHADSRNVSKASKNTRNKGIDELDRAGRGTSSEQMHRRQAD